MYRKIRNNNKLSRNFKGRNLYVLLFAGRACWSLGNAHSSMGQHLEAYQYAKRHLEISRDTKDRMGQATAQLNLADLCRYVNLTCFPENMYFFFRIYGFLVWE